MEKNILKSSENFKNIQIEFLLKKGFYVDILINDKWYQGYIKEEKPNNKYDIIYLSSPNKTINKSNITPKNLSYFGDNYFYNNNMREIALDQKFNELDTINIYDMLLGKLKEINIDYSDIENIVLKIEKTLNFDFNNLDSKDILGKNNSSSSFIIKDDKNIEFNITGFYTYQFLSGFFVDSIVFITKNLEKIRLSSISEKSNLNINEEIKKLLDLILNIIIFVLVITKNNIANIKNYIQINRKSIITNKINSVIASIESILSNILIAFCYEYYEHPKIEFKLKIICILCYEIILDSNKDNNNNFLPIHFLSNLINFILYEDNLNRIDNFERNKVYKIFLTTIQNINGEDLKYIKNFNEIKVYCNTIIKKLYNGEKKVLINNCFYPFLMNSLTKSNILEKKIMALNCINDIIHDLSKEDEINMIFNDFFINKNKIMDIFFEETVHDEILKRSIELFKYLSFFDALNDKLINKLIKLNNSTNNTTIRNILCEIIKNVKDGQKKYLFRKITKNYNFDDNNNRNNIIEFVSKLTLACFSSLANGFEENMTLDNISNEVSSYSKNIIHDNNGKEARRISINIQMIKMGIKTNKNKKISRNSNNLSNIEKFLVNTTNSQQPKKILNLKKKSKKKTYTRNYYGLDLLFNYIIYNYDEVKALTNNSNISKSIKSFKYILDSSIEIKINDIYNFLDKLLYNISKSKKHNSVVQSLILIDILLNRLLHFDYHKNSIYLMPQDNNTINFNELFVNEEEVEIINELNKRYDIITLLTNDLIRYVSLAQETINFNNNNYKKEIIEGIYPYMKNISMRLKIIFSFVNCGIFIYEEEHISKIYSLFKDDIFKYEKSLFFREITLNLDNIDNKTQKNIFKKIFQNNSLFDISSFDDEDTFNLIKNLFINININNESLIDDSKTIRVNQDFNKIDGIDFLFDILISNKNSFIQNIISDNLSHLCLFLNNYNSNFSKKYWNNFISKITDLMEKCNKENNLIGILGLLQLIESIYSYNFSWKIPTKEETHIAEEPYELFHFCCPQKNNKKYKLRVGKIDKLLHMRWKLAYYYDIYVNDLVICDLDNNEYNFTYDDYSFYQIFPPKKYLLGDSQYNFINVYESPGQILKIPNNPKELIEKNETIINILIDNLNISDNNIQNNDDFIMKNKIWCIMQKLPKNKYIEKFIKIFGENNAIEIEELHKRFNVHEIFILTFNLQCILTYINDNQDQDNNLDGNKKKIMTNHFLETFINVHHIDTLILNIFLNIKINNNLSDDNKYIYFECIKYLIELIRIIEEYKMKKSIRNIYSFNTNKDKDKETIQTKHEKEEDKNREEDLEITKVYTSFSLEGSFFEESGNKQLYNKLTDIIILILNDTNASNELICFNLLQELIMYIEHLKEKISNSNSKGPNQNYFEFIFENEELFKKIYIFDFIKSRKEEVKKLLSNFLLKNLFDNYLAVKNKKKDENNNINRNLSNKKYIKSYFNILFTPEMFEYLVKNQKNDSYFNLLSSIIDKYNFYNKKMHNNNSTIEIDSDEENIKYKNNLIKIIDIIINNLSDNNNIDKNFEIYNLLTYPYNNNLISSNSNSINSNKNKNGILQFLLRLLELSLNSSNSVIEYFLKKIDICDIFLLNGILNKCKENILDNKVNIFDDSDSHKIIFEIIIFILKYLDHNQKIINENKYLEDSLYMKVWKILNKYHKLEFLKKKEIKYNDINRKEFVGLENMSSTCYLNSILQQFFMIPLLRETILSIGNEEKVNLEPNTILFQLQLLLASLKTYDFKYYDPKYFVLVSKLSFYEQMDADEYYSLLIDKLEDDISNLYNKRIIKNNYTDLFKYFFGIKLTDELFFTECNHKRFNESFYYNIQLEVKNYSNINDSLKNFFKIEIMSGDNKINCEECNNTKRVCHKQLKIKTLPNILVISLKRFAYNYKTMTKFKLNSYFEFPLELDISEFMLNQNNNEDMENIENISQDNLYELTGITIHYGVADYGHYYDIIKAENNKWYKFNDTIIKEFEESDIPKEAFGEKEDNDLDGEMSDKGEMRHNKKNNAYILIYTKKNFKNNNFQNNSEYNTKIIFPPFDRLSNLNDNIKSLINYKMFKYWALETLSNSDYQSFIIELLKIDLVKNINQEINKTHIELIEDLKNDEYLPIKTIINTGNTIFSYGLLYFCNILIGTNDKNNISLFNELLIVYLENDINKCLYLLEEFSDNEVLEEFFIICQKQEAIKTIIDLIYLSFQQYLLIVDNQNKDNSENRNNVLFKYLNSIILFISYKANMISSKENSLDNIVQLFIKLINKKPLFLNYLKSKKIDIWLEEIINKLINAKKETSTIENNDNNEDEQIKMNIVLTEDDFPKLKSDHCILREKTNFGISFKNDKEIEQLEKKDKSKKAKKTSINSGDSIVLLRRLQIDLK